MLKRWAKYEIEFLKNNYAVTSDKELNQTLHRSVKGISYMAVKLGLKKDYDFYCNIRRKLGFRIKKEDLVKLYITERYSLRDCAKKLSISKNTLDHYLKKFGISKRNRSESSKQRFKRYRNWCEGLTRKTDKRLDESFKKLKTTWKKKENEKIKKLEDKYKLSFPELLKCLYWNNKLTQEKIAQKLDISRKKVIDYMKQYKIGLRPNYEYINSLKGKKHPMYGRTWEEVCGADRANERRKFHSELFRRLIIKRLKNNEMPFSNTKIELSLAKEMSNRNLAFVRQFEVDNKFVCDFAIPSAKLIIECDGDYWHANSKIYDKNKLHKGQINNLKRDKIKDKYLNNKGWKVIRFFESEIKGDCSGCVDKIEGFLKSS